MDRRPSVQQQDYARSRRGASPRVRRGPPGGGRLSSSVGGAAAQQHGQQKKPAGAAGRPSLCVRMAFLLLTSAGSIGVYCGYNIIGVTSPCVPPRFTVFGFQKRVTRQCWQ